MPKYRRKPIIVEAVQIAKSVIQLGGEILLPAWARPYVKLAPKRWGDVDLYVRGTQAFEGDWIIHNADGTCSLRRQSTFAENYEPVEAGQESA